MKKRKALLVDLSQGKIGGLNSRLLGMIILHLLEREVLRRAEPEGEVLCRPRFHIYVDEFHEFITRDLVHLLEAARKYNVGLTLANQHADQLPRRALSAILSSAETFIMLRQGGYSAEVLSPVAQPRFISRDLLALPDFEAIVKIACGRTAVLPERIELLPPPTVCNLGAVAELRNRSLAAYGKSREEVERDLLRRLNWREVAFRILGKGQAESGSPNSADRR